MFFGNLTPKLVCGNVTTCERIPFKFTNSPYRVLFGTREHRETLDDSLKTSTFIDFSKFKFLLSHYHFYGFDLRCNQMLFLNNDLDDNLTWLFLEIYYYKVK